jgi:hypothetical protein
MPEIDERDVRLWFMKTDLEQAEDTFRVVEGIIETRKEFQPKRKKRSDAGQQRIELKEPMDVNPAPVTGKLSK